MENIMKRFRNLMGISMGMSALYIVVGLLLFGLTSISPKVFMVIAGSTIIVRGLFYVIRYVYDGLGTNIFSVDIISGICAVILGVFTVFNPFDPIVVVGILFGIWLLFSAAEKMYYGVRLCKAKDEIFSLVIFISVLSFVMGLLTIFNPFSNFMLITKLISLFMICDGVFDLMYSLLMKKRTKAIFKIFE